MNPFLITSTFHCIHM